MQCLPFCKLNWSVCHAVSLPQLSYLSIFICSTLLHPLRLCLWHHTIKAFLSSQFSLFLSLAHSLLSVSKLYQSDVLCIYCIYKCYKWKTTFHQFIYHWQVVQKSRPPGFHGCIGLLCLHDRYGLVHVPLHSLLHVPLLLSISAASPLPVSHPVFTFRYNYVTENFKSYNHR